MSTTTKYCALTDMGLKRKKNDDFHILETPYSHSAGIRPGAITALGSMFAVADGMGGHPAGDVAARLACATFRDEYYNLTIIEKLFYAAATRLIPPVAARFLLFRLEKAMKAANHEIEAYECTHTKCEGLGTTLSVLVLHRHLAMIAHVGDSRIYRIRDNRAELLTVDHTFVQDLVDMGEMTKDEALKSPMRNVLMQALGQGFDEVFTRCEYVRKGDSFLICSDGLNDMIPDSDIEQTFSALHDKESICRDLIDKALKAGGEDNITVIVTEPVF